MVSEVVDDKTKLLILEMYSYTSLVKSTAESISETQTFFQPHVKSISHQYIKNLINKEDAIRKSSVEEIIKKTLLDYIATLYIANPSVENQKLFDIVNHFNSIFNKTILSNDDIQQRRSTYSKYGFNHSGSYNEELSRISGKVSNYSPNNVFYFSDIVLNLNSNVFTISLTSNLTGSEFLNPFTITNIINPSFNYYPTGLINSHHLEAYLYSINLKFKSENRKILLILDSKNDLLKIDAFSNIDLIYINPQYSYYTKSNSKTINLPDVCGLNDWFKYHLTQTINNDSIEVEDLHQVFESIIKSYNKCISKLLYDPLLYKFNQLNIDKSILKSYSNVSVPLDKFNVRNNKIQIPGECLNVSDTPNYNYSVNDIYFIVSKLLVWKDPSSKVDASFIPDSNPDKIFTFLNNNVYQYLLFNESPALHSFTTFLNEFSSHHIKNKDSSVSNNFQIINNNNNNIHATTPTKRSRSSSMNEDSKTPKTIKKSKILQLLSREKSNDVESGNISNSGSKNNKEVVSPNNSNILKNTAKGKVNGKNTSTGKVREAVFSTSSDESDDEGLDSFTAKIKSNSHNGAANVTAEDKSVNISRREIEKSLKNGTVSTNNGDNDVDGLSGASINHSIEEPEVNANSTAIEKPEQEDVPMEEPKSDKPTPKVSSRTRRSSQVTATVETTKVIESPSNKNTIINKEQQINKQSEIKPKITSRSISLTSISESNAKTESSSEESDSENESESDEEDEAGDRSKKSVLVSQTPSPAQLVKKRPVVKETPIRNNLFSSMKNAATASSQTSKEVVNEEAEDNVDEIKPQPTVQRQVLSRKLSSLESLKLPSTTIESKDSFTINGASKSKVSFLDGIGSDGSSSDDDDSDESSDDDIGPQNKAGDSKAAILDKFNKVSKNKLNNSSVATTPIVNKSVYNFTATTKSPFKESQDLDSSEFEESSSSDSSDSEDEAEATNNKEKSLAKISVPASRRTPNAIDSAPTSTVTTPTQKSPSPNKQVYQTKRSFSSLAKKPVTKVKKSKAINFSSDEDEVSSDSSIGF
ncbi:uncharacterized protein RJT21DRAFT_119854 [Scheffersomyces amazonensis]|uniref:uncharacterized protein n=1 Tax=Scheffersomyces amazonensis TaxID=1078765 RepID=UPI00315C56F6